MSTLIFRHLRKHQINRYTLSIKATPNGGVAFMLDITTQLAKVWIYITPDSVPYSTKHAVHALRLARQNGVVPFTEFILDRTANVNDQLFAHFKKIANSTDIPSMCFALIDEIESFNNLVAESLEEAKLAKSNKKQLYG